MAAGEMSILEALKVTAPLMAGLDFISEADHVGPPTPLDRDYRPCRDWRDARWVVLSSEDYDELKTSIEGGER